MKLAIILLSAAALAVGNPAANTEWKWKPLMPKVSPNVKAAPFPQAFIPPKKVHTIPGHWRAENCGQVSKSSKIVNGQEATPHSYPWQVALFIDGGSFCGGSLISDEWVLTAGHCTTGAGSIEVVMGAHDISTNEASQVSMTSSNIITHESYGPVTLANDVGLIHLPSPVSFTNEIQPVCLPGYSTPDLGAGVTVTASGWGKLSDDTIYVADTLHEATVQTISNSACSSVYGSTVTDATICTDASSGTGTCSGDSGGPLNYVSGGQTFTRGVTSFVASAGCESGLPDGFTRTTHYLDWIEGHTGIAIDP